MKKEHQSSHILSHPDKILYPEDELSKEDVFHYYEAVSDFILPYIVSRPLTLLRCPSQYQKCFYQRHLKHKVAGVHTFSVPNKNEEFIYLDDKEGLLNLIQMGVLEIHPWGSTLEHLDYPDRIIFDLDPAPDVGWDKVVAAAWTIKNYLAQYSLHSFVKTTGGKGLHVVVPIEPEYEWDEVKNFTKIFARLVARLNPEHYVSNMAQSKRAGKIFIDYLRNQRTATAVSVYSTRARIHAPVSTPLAWDELAEKIDDNSYTIKTMPFRLRQLKTDPWANFRTLKQTLRFDE